jgi:peptidoglycan/xylan/chitin deacetylase (PgdA/CDA1 family)
MTAPIISLTFDNGPTPGVTEPVLELLADHSVKATFFAIGRKLATEEGKALGRRIVREGHRLGGHTWSHSVQFGVAESGVIEDELARTRSAVDAAGGDGLLFRPYGAGGVIDDRLMNEFGATTLSTLGYTCVLWNVLPGDWRDPTGWVDTALSDIHRHPWSVVVLHDVVDAALPRLDDFLSTVALDSPTWSHDCPDECTPIRKGSATSSFASLCVAD